MAVVVCPWCQSEVPQEEGQEPERYCPFCENELSGYRTLRLTLGSDGEEEADDGEEGAEAQFEELPVEELPDDDADMLRYESIVEELLNAQETDRECPHCREFMIEAGTLAASPEQFRSQTYPQLGGALLSAPFALTTYLCPSCFGVHFVLSDQDRLHAMRRLVEAADRI